MTVLKQYNSTSSQWETVVVGGPGDVRNVQGVTGIWSGTQAAYDALGTWSSTTLYIIVP